MNRDLEFFESVLNVVHDGLWVTDGDDIIVFINRSMERIAEAPAAAMIGLSVTHDFPEKTTGPFLPYYRQARETLTPVNYEVEVVTPGGRPTIQAGSLTPRVEAGRFAGMICTIQDVTGTRRTEHALLEAGERAERLLDLAPTIFLALDREGTITLLNQEGGRILECPPEEAVGRNWFETFLPGDDRRAIHEVFAQLMAGEVESVQHHENLIETYLNRELRTIQWHNTLLRDEMGRITGTLSSGQDVTASRQAELRLRESETQYRELIEEISDWIWEVDQAGVYDYASPRVRDLLGYEPVEMLGKTPFDFMDPAEAEKVRAIFTRYLEAGLPFDSLENVCIARDGREVVLESSGKPMFDVEGRLVGYRGVDRDITDRKRSEQEQERLQAQLNQAQKLESVGRLAGGVAHDFNNMLLVILGNVDLALQREDVSGPLLGELQEIRKAAGRSADLTHQLLAFARRQTVTPRVLDLNETLTGMLKMLQRLIGEDIDLLWVPGGDLWPVRVDAGQIDRMLANLCINARDAIESVGKVTIETRNVSFDQAFCAERPDFLPGEYVLLAVSDDGCGMDDDTLEYIFEPFFTTKAPHEGTGLGLSTVYGIVKQNEGFVTVYSEPGQGTAFNIYLRRYTGRTTEPQPVAPPVTVARGNETVLFVEDEPSILRLGARMLERRGYKPLTAATPGEALRVAREHPGDIHLLITDVVMPEMNGRELAKRLQSLRPGIRRLFVSGYTASVIVHHGVLEEGVQFLQKPFTEAELAVKVHEALGEG